MSYPQIQKKEDNLIEKWGKNMNKPLTAKNINGPHKHKKMVSLASPEGNAKKTFKVLFLLSRLENICSLIISNALSIMWETKYPK